MPRNDMWKRGQAGRATREDAPGLDAQARLVVMRTIEAVAGSARGVVYDVPLARRPRRRPGTSVFLDDSPEWRRFLASRRRVDDGELALIVSLRRLDDDESRLVVDWGSTYANTFLLVQPHAGSRRLLDGDGQLAEWLQALGRAYEGPGPQASTEDLRDGPLAAAFRGIFGEWLHWSAPSVRGTIEHIPLHLAAAHDTIASRLLPELHERSDQRAFDGAVESLHIRERELFGGPVPRPRSVFRTRLGLPVLADPTCSDRALRRLVNHGRLTVTAPSTPGRPWYGPGRPVPDDMSDDRFAQFVMT